MLPNMYFFESKTIDEFKNRQIKWSIKVNDRTVKISMWLYNHIPVFSPTWFFTHFFHTITRPSKIYFSNVMINSTSYTFIRNIDCLYSFFFILNKKEFVSRFQDYRWSRVWRCLVGLHLFSRLQLYNENWHLKKLCCHLFFKVLLISNLINMNVHVARHVEQNDQKWPKMRKNTRRCMCF